MNSKTLFAVVVFAAITGLAFAKPDGLSKVKNSGTLTIGIQGETPGFCVMNPETNQYEGLEADLARAIAKKLFNNEQKVKFVVVTEKNRTAFLNQDRIDMIIANFEPTEERKQKFDFTDLYYVPKNYAIAIKKDNVAVVKFVNDVLKNLTKTGELNQMLQKNGL